MPRYIEVMLCGLGILVLAPLILFLALIVKLTSRGPVLYCQQRIGQYGQPFMLIKFRSMTHRAPQEDGPLVTIRGDRRVTLFGAFLRQTKLDELPQLWNVIRGDMALVGPRPEVPRYVRHHPRLFDLLLQQRPGITDVCTLHLRREECLLAVVDDPESYYVETLLPRKLGASIREGWRRTFWRDLRVLMATVAPPLAFLAPVADFRPLADVFSLSAGATLPALGARDRRSAARPALRIAVRSAQEGEVVLEQRAELGS